MKATRIVTAALIVSLNVACKAKFTSVNGPQPSAGSAQSAPVPNGPMPLPQGPQVNTPDIDFPTSNNGTDTRPPVSVDPTPSNEPRTCDTQGDGTIDPRRPVSERTVIFKRGRLMVFRYNCEGKVVSKKYESVKKPGRQLIRWLHNGTGYFSAYNRTTCSSMSPVEIRANERHELTLKVSLNAGDEALLVRPGRNLIDYEIGGVRGTLVLNVKLGSGDGCVVYRPKSCPVKPKEQDWSLGGDIFGK